MTTFLKNPLTQEAIIRRIEARERLYASHHYRRVHFGRAVVGMVCLLLALLGLALLSIPFFGRFATP